MARVNSFVTGGKTRRTADKDLAKTAAINIMKAFRQAEMEGMKIKDTWPEVLKRMAKENKEKITPEAVAAKSAPIKKKASLWSKALRALPKSDFLEKKVMKQLAKGTRKGKSDTRRYRTIRDDFELAKSRKVRKSDIPEYDSKPTPSPKPKNKKNSPDKAEVNEKGSKSMKNKALGIAGLTAVSGGAGYALGTPAVPPPPTHPQI
jgi:hypothetical protein